MITSTADIQYAALKTVSPEEITSEALYEEIQKAWADQEPTLTYHIKAWNDRRETVWAELVYMPGWGRAGIAWSGEDRWTDCNSEHEALRRWRADRMTS